MAQYDELRGGIEAIIDRAATADRDVTDAEQTQVDRDRENLTALQTSIEHYGELERQSARVAEVRRALPASSTRTTAPAPAEPEYSLEREFPSAGHYAITLHRAMVRKDPEAIAAIERATAHQTLADNPGLIPRPILGPLVNLIDTSRPFVNSITRKALPAGSFDRPKVTQHVDVDVQGAEKTLTASRELLVGKLPVTARTYAGHLNISRQDVKWTSPGIMQLIYDDFAGMYARRTDADAVAQFLASVVRTQSIASLDGAGIFGAIYGAAGETLSASNTLPDTVWTSPDVWGKLAGVTTGQGVPLWPTFSPGSASASPMGLNLVVDAHFPAGTMVLGASRHAEWYEDVDGLMQVGEPDVLGQLVGFAGFGAFLNVAPETFTELTLPAV